MFSPIGSHVNENGKEKEKRKRKAKTEKKIEMHYFFSKSQQTSERKIQGNRQPEYKEIRLTDSKIIAMRTADGRRTNERLTNFVFLSPADIHVVKRS